MASGDFNFYFYLQWGGGTLWIGILDHDLYLKF